MALQINLSSVWLGEELQPAVESLLEVPELTGPPDLLVTELLMCTVRGFFVVDDNEEVVKAPSVETRASVEGTLERVVRVEDLVLGRIAEAGLSVRVAGAVDDTVCNVDLADSGCSFVVGTDAESVFCSLGLQEQMCGGQYALAQLIIHHWLNWC